jgi:hypothetical protein
LVCLLLVSCTHQNPTAPQGHPEWLTTLIRGFEGQPVANPPLSVTRYDYKGQVVYFVPQRCCDVFSDVYRADGTVLCHPDGGQTGRGDGGCVDFFTERKNPQLIWQDPRTGR